MINFSTGTAGAAGTASTAGTATDTISMEVEMGTSTQGTEGTGGTEGSNGTGGAEGKPTPEELGIDLARLVWQRSGEDDGSIEIAFPLSAAWTRGDWVLMRVAGDPSGRILVFDRNEWDCFLDGVRNGEFDDATNRGESDS